MNIWYFNHYAGGPGIAKLSRAHHLSRAWAGMGHQTTIFVARFHHMLTTLKPLPDFISVDAVNYMPLDARRYSGNGLGRLLNMADFCRSMSKLPARVPSVLQPPDVVIVSSPHPFAILPGWWLAKRYGAQLTFEVRDLWPLSFIEILGLSKWHPFVLLTGLVERFAYRNSDLVASLLGGAEEYMLGRGLAPKKFVHVPNGLVQDDASLPEPGTEAGKGAARQIEEWKKQGRVIVIHPGAQGVPNSLDRLLDAVGILNKGGLADKFGVLLVGNGEMTNSLKTQARTLEAGNVVFCDSIPKTEARWLTVRSDIGYSGSRNKPNLYQYGTSFNKTVDYMQAGIPVLLPIHAPLDPVAISGSGVVTGSDDPGAIAAALQAMLDMTPQQRDEMGAKGKAYAADVLDYKVIASNYISSIEKTCPR